MATVVDKSHQMAVDRPYTFPNRTSGSSPIGALTPQYRGEIVAHVGASGAVWYKAVGSTNQSWQQITAVLDAA